MGGGAQHPEARVPPAQLLHIAEHGVVIRGADGGHVEKGAMEETMTSGSYKSTAWPVRMSRRPQAVAGAQAASFSDVCNRRPSGRKRLLNVTKSFRFHSHFFPIDYYMHLPGLN